MSMARMPRSPSRSRSPAGTWSSSSSGGGRPRNVDRGAGELPLVGGGDVGEQDPGVRPGDPDDHEEVLVDRDQADRAAVAGEPAQGVGEGLDVPEGVVGELLHLPDAFLPVGGQREVHSVLLVGHAHSSRSRGRTQRGSSPEWQNQRPRPTLYPCSQTPDRLPWPRVSRHAHPRRRPPARRPQAHRPAGRADRLADVPPAGRRAGDAAGLRGDPRRAGLGQGDRHPGRADDRRQARPPQAARRADPAGRARACSTG